MNHDAELREVSGPAGRVRLTPLQHEILAALLDRPGRLVSRDAMMARLYAARPDNPPEERSLDVAICRVRSALRGAGLGGAVETVRGAGWVWRPPGTA